MLETLQPAPPDAILGLSEAFRADDRSHKINLAVGVYKDESGVTPVLGAVKDAERRLLGAETTKSYLPIDGPPALGPLVRSMLFGEGDERVGGVEEGGRAATSTTPGGTGGLRVAGDFVKQNFAGATVWLSDPTWANHHGIFRAAGLPTSTYRWYDGAARGLDFGGALQALEEVPAGDVVVLHGCCHNPTGADPTAEQWRRIAGVLSDRGVLPLVDFAYQGFGDGLDEDAAGLREVAAANPELLVCSSFSKNFGLYRDRVGALTVVAADADAAAAAQSLVKQAIRRNYSNPPAHGALVVQTVLEDEGLTADWKTELDGMRARINGMRAAIQEGLDARGVRLSPEGNGFVARQRGMFTLTGLSREQVRALREEHAVYAVGDGRINVAGVVPSNVDALCDAVAAVSLSG